VVDLSLFGSLVYCFLVLVSLGRVFTFDYLFLLCLLDLVPILVV